MLNPSTTAQKILPNFVKVGFLSRIFLGVALYSFLKANYAEPVSPVKIVLWLPLSRRGVSQNSRTYIKHHVLYLCPIPAKFCRDWIYVGYISVRSSQKQSNNCLLYARLCHGIVYHISGIMLDIFPSNPRKKWSNSCFLYVPIGHDLIQHSSGIILGIFLSNPHQKWSHGQILYVQMAHALFKHSSGIIFDVFLSESPLQFTLKT